MIKVEMLISTMNCLDFYDLYRKMNIKTDAIFINQCDKNSFFEFKVGKSKVRCFSFKEKGVGLSRNNALMRSSADICIMSDDDMIYKDNYLEIIKKQYDLKPMADMILFNSLVKSNEGVRNNVTRNGRVRHYNCLKYGTVTFTFKRESIIKNNIYFSLLFGGGTRYGSGEDSLFIWSILNKRLKVYSSTETIAIVNNYVSSWFEGYTYSYFYDRGALFKSLMPYNYRILIIQFLLRHRDLYKKNNFKFKDVYKIMREGAENL
ncbi:glycosyltransferase family A protein [Vagococcus teuberi]|nr:glycosyltransferase family A protein [Vagococcus teuberi]